MTRTEPTSIIIKTLGGFSIQQGEVLLSDSDDRSKKPWKLLAYLLHHRDRTVSKEELIGLLWGEKGTVEDHLGALKTLLHRVRGLLDRLPDANGRSVILRCKGGYIWNPTLPIRIDTDQFEALTQSVKGADLPEEKLNAALHAIALYRGKYLGGLYDREEWASAEAHRMETLYLNCYYLAVQILAGEQNYDQIVFLSRHGMKIAPTEESFYYNEISALIEKGDDKEALAAYDRAMDLFYQVYRITPSDRLRTLYRSLRRVDRGIEPDLSLVQSKLEIDRPEGGMCCEYDTFKLLYQQITRQRRADGDRYLILLTIVKPDRSDGAPAPRVLDRVLSMLEERLRHYFSPGDVFTRYSLTQLLVLATFENEDALMCVLSKILRAIPAHEVGIAFRTQKI